MADKAKKEKAPKPMAPSAPTRCVADECKEKPKRLNFCNTHFVWFKEGLITRQGQRVKDFDKKYQAYLRKQHKAA